MKKDITIIFSVLLLAALCFAPLIVYETRYDDAQKQVGRALDIKLDVLAGGIVEEHISSYGFHGDGETYIQIRFEDDSAILRELEKNNWNHTPVPEDLRRLLNYMNGMEGIQLPSDEEIGEGYFYFLDRHSDAINRQDSRAALGRYSENLTATFYSIARKTLWYSKFDS